MQLLTFTFNEAAQEPYPTHQWLFWMIVLWIITEDDTRQRERKRRLARQQHEDDEQHARHKCPPAPKPPTP